MVKTPPDIWPNEARQFDEFFEQKYEIIAGTDEAGRGPLAGPVVAAAVILDPRKQYPKIGDSKKLSESARLKAYDLIAETAISWAWAEVVAAEVDRLNPLRASMEAMARAVLALNPKPKMVLVDGNVKPTLPMEAITVVKGDSRSLAIGAASIMAKVTRDRIMLDFHEKYPQYGFDRHKGYGAKTHLEALRKYGPSLCHRLSFRGVKPSPQLSFDFVENDDSRGG
ncbi:MAG: ribonuclease HII [Candidatus Adiutrix sp.]